MQFSPHWKPVSADEALLNNLLNGNAGHYEHARSESPEEQPSQPAFDEEPIDPKIDDIRREFHPHSQRKATLQTLQDYRTSESSACRGPPTDQQPWLPFRTRLDFEVSEFAQEAMLNQNQVDTLVSLIRRCAAYIDGFTLTNHADMNKQWDLASKKCTQFQKFDIAVPYKTGEQTFEMHARPLWDWARDLIQDPSLSSYFVWDAERAYKYDGDNFVRFFTEPWTANALWDVQSKLPNDKAAKSCPYILYADKSKLSSFGTQKGYPVVARLANTVVSIRNSNGCWGGGQIVGWLPVIADDSGESGKKGYADFKNAVWHASFYKLLESIVEHSKTGIWTPCGDGEVRWLFPMILILASDYEEACVMALIRGLQALYPCPICYVKKEEQADHSIVGKLRTAAESQDTMREGRAKKTAEEREDVFKNQSLRNIENAFWNVANSDPHKALSFDRLHAHASGLWGGHLFPLHEDIAKMMVFAAHTILTDKLGFSLLQAIRGYVELDMYASFKLHTSETIAAGRRAHERFGELINMSYACHGTDFEDKNWDFPKMHSHRHLFDDIENKGVTLNFGTKIDEAMHGPARATYLRQTNFRDVADQILKADHRRLIGKFIRDQISDLDGLLWGDEDDIPSDLEEVSNVMVGSKQKSTLFSAIEIEMQTDLAFHNFRIRFSNFLSNFLQVYGHGLPDGKLIKFTPDNEVIPFHFLKVFFQSLVNWEDGSDYLRCSPIFYGHPRYDTAIVKTSTGTLVVKLIYIFTCRIDDKVHAFALVQPMDAGTGQLTFKDKALGFYRVRAKPRQNSEFISVHSIVRGGPLSSCR
ncbi:hypothetical protein C8J57DRAFT_1434112 [Mycena rebaudengoi]|nr:hypothetical protein C8J57DRAFT_1434112 [Mycena rebaudengoi]